MLYLRFSIQADFHTVQGYRALWSRFLKLTTQIGLCSNNNPRINNENKKWNLHSQAGQCRFMLQTIRVISFYSAIWSSFAFSITLNELPQESVAVFLISISVLLLKQTFVSVWHLLTSRRLPPYEINAVGYFLFVHEALFTKTDSWQFLKMKPLSPKSHLHEISPCNINTL